MTLRPRRAKVTTGKILPMKFPYLYVEARAYPDTWKVDAAGTVHNDQPISFDSIVVQARNEDDAYQLGAACLQSRQQDEDAQDQSGDITTRHSQQFFLNDYVVKL